MERTLGVESPDSQTPIRLNLFREIERHVPGKTHASLCGATEYVKKEFGRLTLK